MATHVTNVIVETRHDRAASESYAISIEQDADGRVRWRSGRYLDMWTGAPDGHWRISGRLYVLDTDLPVPRRAVETAPIGTHVQGTRDRHDPSFALFSGEVGTPWPADRWQLS